MSIQKHGVMLQGVRRSDLCFYIGAAYDLINPLVNTECRRLVCVDLIDKSYYPVLDLELGLPRRVERDVHMYSIINRFAKQWIQLSEENPWFGRISRVRVKGNRFEIAVIYKNRQRLIVFYSGVDGNDAPGPEEIRGRELGVLYISMGRVEPATIRRLKPRQIIVYHTTLNDDLKQRKHRAVTGIRISPFTDKIRVRKNAEYLVFAAKLGRGEASLGRGAATPGAV